MSTTHFCPCSTFYDEKRVHVHINPNDKQCLRAHGTRRRYDSFPSREKVGKEKIVLCSSCLEPKIGEIKILTGLAKCHPVRTFTFLKKTTLSAAHLRFL